MAAAAGGSTGGKEAPPGGGGGPTGGASGGGGGSGGGGEGEGERVKVYLALRRPDGSGFLDLVGCANEQTASRFSVSFQRFKDKLGDKASFFFVKFVSGPLWDPLTTAFDTFKGATDLSEDLKARLPVPLTTVAATDVFVKTTEGGDKYHVVTGEGHPRDGTGDFVAIVCILDESLRGPRESVILEPPGVKSLDPKDSHGVPLQTYFWPPMSPHDS